MESFIRIFEHQITLEPEEQESIGPDFVPETIVITGYEYDADKGGVYFLAKQSSGNTLVINPDTIKDTDLDKLMVNFPELQVGDFTFAAYTQVSDMWNVYYVKSVIGNIVFYAQELDEDEFHLLQKHLLQMCYPTALEIVEKAKQNEPAQE